MLRALGLPGALAHSSLRISQGRKVELENALLSKEQQAALARIKRYTDFNDLATQSSRSQERVKRQVKITPHCCKNFTLRSPLRERIPAYREGSACCHGCGIRDYPIAPAVRSGNVAQNALRACYAGTRRAFVKFFMQHWGTVNKGIEELKQKQQQGQQQAHNQRQQRTRHAAHI